MIRRNARARASSSLQHVFAMCAALVGGLAVCPAVRADDAADALKVRTAAQEFDAGRRAYTAGDYTTAADHFENAYHDMPSVEALRLAIRSQQRAGNLARAATLSELALVKHGDDAGTVTLARSVLKQVRPKVFKVAVQCTPECGVVVDDHAVFDDSYGKIVVYVTPGKHEVAATWKADRSRAVEVQGEAGEETDAVFRAPVHEEAKSPEEPPSSVQVKSGASEPGPDKGTGLPAAVTYVGIGLTAALAGATIWSGIDTRNNPGRDAVREQCVDQGASCPLYQDALSRQKRTNILLGTTIGVAVVTAVIGAAYTDWGDGEKAGKAPESTGPSVAPAVGWLGGPQLGAVGRF